MIEWACRYFADNKRSISLFLTVGAVAALVNFGAFAICWHVFHFNYSVSVSVSFVLSVVFHFFSNRRFTFKSLTVSLHAQLPKYLSMVFFNYLVTMVIMKMVVGKMHLSPYLGLVAAIGTTVWVGYALSKYWVFRTEGE